MWLFTKHGFYSIVQKAPNEWHIRSRAMADLENLRAVYLGLPAPVESYPGSDYPFRIILQGRNAAAAMAQMFVLLSKSIDYPNFKSRISCSSQREKLAAYGKIWAIMKPCNS